MSKMTAAELYEIVKDVPRDAWPEVMESEDGAWYHRYGPSFSAQVAEGDAALMFVGSMVAWLATYGEVVVTPTFDSGSMSYVSIQVCNHDWIGGKTLIAALAAACKGVQ
jgi:hypothetical protein